MTTPKQDQKHALLDILSRVKTRVQDNIGIIDFPVPQFILIGSQSVGKSRLIEAFAGEQFNFVSGSLGSRRPTVLEFRNVASLKESKWSVLDKEKGQWVTYEMEEVMKYVGEKHQSLGHDVSPEAIHVRVESPECVDMQIVDLPGYREFSGDEPSKKLATKIEGLNKTFLEDPKNVVLCVEQAGDAANMKSLARVKEVDPDYKRTILIRNKLDKYYNDLSAGVVNRWIDGNGDIPKNLQKFALTLPHWGEDKKPSKPLSDLRKDMNKADVDWFKKLNVSDRRLETIGFDNFAIYMESRIERMFVDAIEPVLKKLKETEEKMLLRQGQLVHEMESSNPESILETVRGCGVSFAHCLTQIMAGYIPSNINLMSMEQELLAFQNWHVQLGSASPLKDKFGDIDNPGDPANKDPKQGFDFIPNKDFPGLEDYIDHLKTLVSAHEVELNGGAQFRRLMIEVEAFLRFSEIGQEIKKKDVLQAFGVSIGSITWRDVVVKLLNYNAHLPLQHHVRYVGERIRWFFLQQKEPILHFMKSLQGSHDAKLYSENYPKRAKLIEDNPTIKKLVYDAYDQAVDRRLNQFIELFKSTLQATFSNPWVFMKAGTATLQEKDDEEFVLPMFEETCERIPEEMGMRSKGEHSVDEELYAIPTEPQDVDQAVDQVQMLVLRVYSHIRSQVCDQVELFAESFFKLPLLRRLEDDMAKVKHSEEDLQCFKIRRDNATSEERALREGLTIVQQSRAELQEFAMTSLAQGVSAAALAKSSPGSP